MTRLYMDLTGPGSYDEVLDYLETVIRHNCTLQDGVLLSSKPEDRPRRLAKNTLYSILSRLDIHPGADPGDTCGQVF